MPKFPSRYYQGLSVYIEVWLLHRKQLFNEMPWAKLDSKWLPKESKRSAFFSLLSSFRNILDITLFHDGRNNLTETPLCFSWFLLIAFFFFYCIFTPLPSLPFVMSQFLFGPKLMFQYHTT